MWGFSEVHTCPENVLPCPPMSDDWHATGGVLWIHRIHPPAIPLSLQACQLWSLPLRYIVDQNQSAWAWPLWVTWSQGHSRAGPSHETAHSACAIIWVPFPSTTPWLFYGTLSNSSHKFFYFKRWTYPVKYSEHIEKHMSHKQLSKYSEWAHGYDFHSDQEIEHFQHLRSPFMPFPSH